MSKKSKLLNRLEGRPTDFTWLETVKLMSSLGYRVSEKGKTSGSRMVFLHEKYPRVLIHKPHPHGLPLKAYQIHDLLKSLREAGVFNELQKSHGVQGVLRVA